MTIPLPTNQELRPDLEWQDIVSIIGMFQALGNPVVLEPTDDTPRFS